MRIFIYGAVLLLFVTLWGCGNGNNSSVVLDATGKHAANWVINHGSFCRVLPGINNPDAALSSACSGCHGSDLTGGIVKVSCMSNSIGGTFCHATSPLANPGCTSCHGNPPATGKHVKHAALAGLTCATSCHNNFGPGTVSHANGTVNTALSPTYMAKPGVAAILNPNGTCSNVSCHGGQTTPPWLSGSINVNTDCTLCHASGTIQYNSYYSGEHAFHVSDAGLGCTSCHNTATLAVSHFTHLETAVMEGPASATVGGGTSAVASYNSATRSCTPNDNRPFPTGLCHPTRVWP